MKRTATFFESAQKYYWPVDDAELTFIALSTNWTGTRAFTSSSDIKMTDVTIDKNVKNQADMIYVSGATGKKSVNEGKRLGLGKWDHDPFSNSNQMQRTVMTCTSIG